MPLRAKKPQPTITPRNWLSIPVVGTPVVQTSHRSWLPTMNDLRAALFFRTGAWYMVE
jgi:hypothetical protein